MPENEMQPQEEVGTSNPRYKAVIHPLDPRYWAIEDTANGQISTARRTKKYTLDDYAALLNSGERKRHELSWAWEGR